MEDTLTRIYSYANVVGSASRPYHIYIQDHIICVAPIPSENQIFATCKSRDETLTGYVEWMKLSESRDASKGFEKPLLTQLAYAVKHIHHSTGSNDVCPTLTEGQNADDHCFFFSGDGKHIILKIFEVNPSKTKADDIKSLRNLFQYIIRDKIGKNQDKKWTCSEPSTVAHLIEKMRSKDFTADDILKHPYFWNSMKKIKFLCSVCQIHQANGLDPNLGQRLSGDELRKFRRKFSGWEKNLTIKPRNNPSTDEKIDAVTTLFRELSGFYNRSGKSSSRYDRDFPAFELLRFFRNCAAHYWSKEIGWKNNSAGKRDRIHRVVDNARTVFKSEHEGFWNFFSTQFPDLFIWAYKYAIEYEVMKKNLDETGYFSELAPFNDLVRKDAEPPSQTKK